jgi:hypothetical protein
VIGHGLVVHRGGRTPAQGSFAQMSDAATSWSSGLLAPFVIETSRVANAWHTVTGSGAEHVPFTQSTAVEVPSGRVRVTCRGSP